MSDDQQMRDVSLFAQKQIRRVWHKGEWYYSITDVIAVLTDSPHPRNYWAVLKNRVKAEGLDEAFVQIEQLRLKSLDGRFRHADTANRQTVLRHAPSRSASGSPRSARSALKK
jgi:prophage antirepressor-like protein